jgi:hypothetical protein
MRRQAEAGGVVKRHIRQILRAARFLELEAEEYVQAGKEATSAEDRLYFGNRAKRMLGVARSIKEYVKTGKYPSNRKERKPT